ncbi:ATP-binding protein [Paramicrobacterium fandaimingii]|uniref:ATP-binding protein n=1 Tax=Paramicrobacterium fandaimingii TaxID=2708079 RepID=UPI0018A05D3A|nr:DUF4143 domain-containing protein [Microbacterium fandaimingii]
MTYSPRIIDSLLDDLVPELAAIALEGAKGVGKTATATQRAATIFSLNKRAQRAVVAADPEAVTLAAKPTFIDEWQLVPDVWEEVRSAVDNNTSGGQFLLAGSAGIAPGVRIHSGAGRIISLTMRPLAFSERGIATPAVSLGELLSGVRPRVTGTTSVSLDTYTDEILRSGFPGIRGLGERGRKMQLDSYLSRLVARELPENGVSIRHPGALMKWLAAYGAATSTDASYTTLLDAASAGVADKPARSTIESYREHLERLYVLDPLPPWIPTFNPLKRLRRSPKHHLVDPGLAARLVGVGKSGLLHGEGTVSQSTGTWLGALFESLATQSIRVYAEPHGAQLGHLRTSDNRREIDLIVEGEDRGVVAIEVKLAATIGDRDVRHLNWLQDQIGDRLADKVVVNTGPYAYRRPDGVAVVPLALLGP